MPILNADAANLEWRTIVEISRDKIAIEEINNGLDFHTDNQKRFNLPSRLIAKIFLFRWIFLGSAYAYSKDPDFAAVSTKEAFWQDIIDQFNEKYEGIAQYHRDSIREVYETGQYVHPLTGRVYVHTLRERRGDMQYNPSEIVNFPVQGLGADMMALIRTEIFKRLEQLEDYQNGLILPMLTVHDSVMYDCAYKSLTSGNCPWYNISMIVAEVFQNFRQIWKDTYGTDLVVNQDCEIQVGVNWKYMHSIYKGGKFNFSLLKG